MWFLHMDTIYLQQSEVILVFERLTELFYTLWLQQKQQFYGNRTYSTDFDFEARKTRNAKMYVRISAQIKISRRGNEKWVLPKQENVGKIRGRFIWSHDGIEIVG